MNREAKGKTIYLYKNWNESNIEFIFIENQEDQSNNKSI
jgi:hypothetical protein